MSFFIKELRFFYSSRLYQFSSREASAGIEKLNTLKTQQQSSLDGTALCHCTMEEE